jgi:hypothetical protein
MAKATRIRSLMLLIAGVGFLLALPGLLEKFIVAYGIGDTVVALEFVALDAVSGKPVPGARLQLTDPECPNPRPPLMTAATTDADGRSTITNSFEVTSSWSGLTGRRFWRGVRYPLWEMRIEAAGYKPFEAQFHSYVAKDRRYHEDRVPPPIMVRLQREQTGAVATP